MFETDLNCCAAWFMQLQNFYSVQNETNAAINYEHSLRFSNITWDPYHTSVSYQGAMGRKRPTLLWVWGNDQRTAAPRQSYRWMASLPLPLLSSCAGTGTTSHLTARHQLLFSKTHIELMRDTVSTLYKGSFDLQLWRRTTGRVPQVVHNNFGWDKYERQNY